MGYLKGENFPKGNVKRMEYGNGEIELVNQLDFQEEVAISFQEKAEIQEEEGETERKDKKKYVAFAVMACCSALSPPVAITGIVIGVIAYLVNKIKKALNHQRINHIGST